MTTERSLTQDESRELNSLLEKSYALLPSNLAQDDAIAVITAIQTKINELRQQNIAQSAANEIAFTLGYLYGEQLCKTVNWQWRYVIQDNGFESYCVVSPDKSFVCFSIKCVYDLLLNSAAENSTLLLFNMINAGSVPNGQPGRYQSLSF